jgi:hypothetical protein
MITSLIELMCKNERKIQRALLLWKYDDNERDKIDSILTVMKL